MRVYMRSVVMDITFCVSRRLTKLFTKQRMFDILSGSHCFVS